MIHTANGATIRQAWIPRAKSKRQRTSSSVMAAGMQALAQATKDHAEAATAFAEKRRPNFTGE